MKKKYTVLMIVLFTLVMAPAFSYVRAEEHPRDGVRTGNELPLDGNGVRSGVGSTKTPTFTLKNPLKVDSIGGLVQNFVEIFSYIVILFAVLMLIWVGLRFILARGDVTEMKKLKDWLLWIVVGVAVVIGARLIIQVVINTLSATGTIDQGVINSTNNALYNR